MELLAVERPFLHVLASGVLSAADEAQILLKLEQLQWTDSSGDFFRFRMAANADQLAGLAALPALKTMVNELRPALERLLNKPLSGDVGFAAQRYHENSAIGFHTDELESGVRFVLNFNRSWEPPDGGVWVLSDEPTLGNGLFVPPLSNTGFAFATDPSSFHALGRRARTISYALVTRYPVCK
jgi:hypothetical protein